MKLLSPAGDEKALKLAVFNGADEIYLGVKDFNARNNIQGFDMDGLKSAINFCHMYSVKVFLTVNILFSDSEIQKVVDLIVDANNLGVDAFIIRDIGLATIIKKYYPTIVMHASTQMAVHNLEGVRELEKLGFSRVVLARETSLAEIERIHKNSDIEIEFFVHGALCVSFSGNCYLSSYLEGASGNRGKCKQLCRLPYSLGDNRKEYANGCLLSTKDLCLINHLEQLSKAGVMSLKIEGRARRPYYVATATKIYREALDNIKHRNLADTKRVQAGELLKNQTSQDNMDRNAAYAINRDRCDANKNQELELAFNRGFTPAYFDNNKMISKVQGHNGLEIGKVFKVNNGKTFNEIFIATDYEISPKSSLKFFRDDALVATISSHDVRINNGVVKITSTTNVEVGDSVNIFVDYEKEKLAEEFVRKIPVNIDVQILPDICTVINLTVGEKYVQYIGDNFPLAKSKSLTMEEVAISFGRSEYFAPIVNGEIGDVFVTKSQLNDIRRKAYAMLQEVLAKHENKQLKKIQLSFDRKVIPLKNFKFIESINEIVEKDANYLYNSQNFDRKELIVLSETCKNNNSKLYLYLPHYATKEDIEVLKSLVEELSLGIVVNNLYALDFQVKDKIAGTGLNIYNKYSAEYFNLPALVAENKELGIQQTNAPYMVLRHCPIKEFVGGHCGNCLYNNNLYYTMQNGKKLKLKRWKVKSCTFYLTD